MTRQQNYDDTKKSYKKWSAKEMAVHLLSRRDHGEWELKQKLLLKSYEIEEVEQALAYCQQNKWLDDLRYAKSQVRQWSARGYGELKIKQELMLKKIPASTIDEALNLEDIDWFELAKYVASKKFKNEIAKDPKSHAKQMRFLQYRGFGLDEINYAIPQPRFSQFTLY